MVFLNNTSTYLLCVMLVVFYKQYGYIHVTCPISSILLNICCVPLVVFYKQYWKQYCNVMSCKWYFINNIGIYVLCVPLVVLCYIHAMCHANMLCVPLVVFYKQLVYISCVPLVVFYRTIGTYLLYVPPVVFYQKYWYIRIVDQIPVYICYVSC